MALGPVGSGGADCGVADAVTPLETSGVALPLIAQMRNEYCVSEVSPVTVWLVPVTEASEMVVPAAQFAGAEAPLW